MLLPCPCCGSTDLELMAYDEPRCIPCGLEGATVKDWNTRTLPVEVQAVMLSVSGRLCAIGAELARGFMSDYPEDYPKSMSRKVVRQIEAANERLRLLALEIVSIRESVKAYKDAKGEVTG